MKTKKIFLLMDEGDRYCYQNVLEVHESAKNAKASMTEHQKRTRRGVGYYWIKKSEIILK